MAPHQGFEFVPTGRQDIRNAAASGLLNALLYGEDRARAVSVVRGGNRSFLTGSHLGGPLGIVEPGTSSLSEAAAARRASVPRSALTKRGTVRVGGTLRRGWHAIVYVDGHVFPGSRRTTLNGDDVPSYPTGGSPSGIVGIIGNNVAYSGFVDQGTYKMPARPMLWPAVRDMAGAIAGLFRAGWQRYASRRA